MLSARGGQLGIIYRGGNKGLHVLLSRTQAGPGRTVKQKQEEISRNHIQTFISPSVYIVPLAIAARPRPWAEGKEEEEEGDNRFEGQTNFPLKVQVFAAPLCDDSAGWAAPPLLFGGRWRERE